MSCQACEDTKSRPCGAYSLMINMRIPMQPCVNALTDHIMTVMRINESYVYLHDMTQNVVLGLHDMTKALSLAAYRHVKRSMHGTHMMSTGEIREAYGRELVNLRNENRWTFLNTLFSVSEAVMYMQASLLHALCSFAP